MKGDNYCGIFLLLGLLFALSSLFPSIAQSETSYSDLQALLEQENHPDSDLVNQLPRPTTPLEYWLRARVEPTFKKAQVLLKSAINKSDNPQKKSRYLKTLLRISLLGNFSNELTDYIPSRLNDLRSAGRIPSELAMLAGKWFLDQEMFRDAIDYFNYVKRESPYYPDALLSRAESFLKLESHSKARRVLERYFFSDLSEDRQRYWLLKGRMFEQADSDSEAYVAYSHLINNYPKSLLRSEAERRISDLPLPEPLYPDRSTEVLTREPVLRGGTSINLDDQNRTNTQQKQQSGDLQIQVGSFQDPDRANSLRRSLQSWINYPISVQEAVVDGNTYHRVKVRSIESKKKARKLLQQIKSSGYEGFITGPG